MKEHRTRETHTTVRVVLLVFVTLLLAPPYPSQAQQKSNTDALKPYSKIDLKRVIENGINLGRSLDSIIDLVREVGVNFPTTAEEKADLTASVGKFISGDKLRALFDAMRDNYRPTTGEKMRVSLFGYVPCAQQQQIEQMLQSKISTLESRLASQNHNAQYVTWLRLVRENKLFDMSEAEADGYLEVTKSLQLLEGLCTVTDEGVLLTSRVHLAKPNSKLGSAIVITFKIDPSEYYVTKDIHSLLILYSLASDAIRTGKGSDVVMTYLSEAQNVAGQIKNPDPAVQSVMNAINAMLEEQKARQ